MVASPRRGVIPQQVYRAIIPNKNPRCAAALLHRILWISQPLALIRANRSIESDGFTPRDVGNNRARAHV
jgi:hypothetical protein